MPLWASHFGDFARLYAGSAAIEAPLGTKGHSAKTAGKRVRKALEKGAEGPSFVFNVSGRCLRGRAA